jgi:hypothetical protein
MESYGGNGAMVNHGEMGGALKGHEEPEWVTRSRGAAEEQGCRGIRGPQGSRRALGVARGLGSLWRAAVALKGLRGHGWP